MTYATGVKDAVYTSLHTVNSVCSYCGTTPNNAEAVPAANESTIAAKVGTSSLLTGFRL